jgi:arylsulfatase A-like enzyme
MRRLLPQRWSVFLLAPLSALAISCERSEVGAPGASVVLISIDTLRSDRLPAYGHEAVATPSIDRLAAESVLFERAYSHYPLTLPSHASIFTGLLPPRHGVRDNKGFRLREEHSTLAERLHGAGYRTRGVVSSMVLRSGTGIAQGFEAYDDRMPKRGSRRRTFAQRRGDVAVEVATRWLDELVDGRPFFLFVHLFDPHAPYEAPEPFASRYEQAYDAEIAYTDRLVGDLLQALEDRGLYDAALIVLLSFR